MRATTSHRMKSAWIAVLTVLTTGLALTLGSVGLAHAAEPNGPDSCETAPDTVALPDGLRPEGIASGPGSTFYVGSLADGRIITGDLCTGSQRELLAGATGRQLRGLMYDRRTGLVWAAGNVGTEGHVYAVDADTGEIVQDTVVPGAVFLNDLVVTRTAVWVTDSRVDRLTRIDLNNSGWPAGTAPGFLPLTGDWPAYTGTGNNANGIRELRDGSLVLNNSAVGGLWQVSAETGEVTEIPVTGNRAITQGDGLELAGPYLFNVRGNNQTDVEMLRLHWSRDGWTATWTTALTHESLNVPSTATYAVGSLWAVNARFGVADPGTAEYWITRLDTDLG